MPNKILVTYATCTGSTMGVAEAVGKAIAESGAEVDVRPMQEVTDLSPYRAVVAGSAIQHGEWLPEAMQFVRAHQAELKQKPFATFLVCMTLAMKHTDNREKSRETVATWLEPVRALVRPVSEGQFAGALDLRKLPKLRDRLAFWFSVKIGVWTEGDHRDWEAIHAWGAGLPKALGQ